MSPVSAVLWSSTGGCRAGISGLSFPSDWVIRWAGSTRGSLHPGSAGTQAHAMNTEALKAARAAGRLLSHNRSGMKSADTGSKHLAHEDVFAVIFILNQHRS